MKTIRIIGFVIVAIAAVIGVGLLYKMKVSYDYFGEKEKMPLSFWLYVAWVAFLVILAAFIFLILPAVETSEVVAWYHG